MNTSEEYMIKYYRNQMDTHPIRTLSVMCVIIVLLAYFSYWMHQDMEEKQAAYDAYLLNNACVKVGYVGQHPQPLYRCKDGLFAKYEIWKIVRGGIDD